MKHLIFSCDRNPACRILRVLVVMLVVGPLVAGCASSPREIVDGRAYPTSAPPGETLDIQVFRHQTEIEFTNTTARSFGPSTVWLNRRFSREIESLEVGQTMRFPLREFRDRFGESFRAGGFFAVERPERLAVAELETIGPEGDATVLGLVVVGTGQ